MAVSFYLKRTNTASKRPVATGLAAGELALNYDAATGGLFYCNATGGVVKVGPAQISAAAPNSSPAGSAGNSAGEFWFDTANSSLKVWDGSAWRTAGGAPLAQPTVVGEVFGRTCSATPFSTFLGFTAGNAITTGTENTAVGFCALTTNATGFENTAVGAFALRTTNCNYNTAVGRRALCSAATNENVAIGRDAMFGTGLTGAGQVAVGAYALQLNAGQANVGVGKAAACSTTTGSFNTAVGHEVLFFNTTGSSNTAIGQGALSQGLTNNCNVAVGNAAGGFGTSTCGVYVGFQAGLRVSGTDNTVVGNCALATAGAITVNNNTVLGARSAQSLTTGSCNVVVGVGTAPSMTTGTCNVLVGQSAGSVLTTGNNNIVIGTQSMALGPAVNGSGNVYIGHNFNSTYATDNQVIIAGGSGTHARFLAGATSWTFASDGRLKDNVQDLQLGLDFVKKVRPVTYTWKECEDNDESIWGMKKAGFIAQELLATEEEFDAEYVGAVDTGNLDSLGVASPALIPVLVKAVQELAAANEQLTARVEQLEAQLSAQG